MTREYPLKDPVAIEMKRYFGTDLKRIRHAAEVAQYAEQIVKEEGGDPAVVLFSAFLHDIGIKNAELKYQSNEARYQELEEPPVAREILTRMDVKDELIQEVCDIIGHHHHPRKVETLNFKILFDADLVVNLKENQKEKSIDREKLTTLIERSLFTETGKRLAQNLLMKTGVEESSVQGRKNANGEF